MEKVITKPKQVEDRIHYFYCDDCGIEIGHSQEYDDGYYAELGKFELKWYTPNGWYKLKKCLCKSCERKVIITVCEALESVGFERY